MIPTKRKNKMNRKLLGTLFIVAAATHLIASPFFDNSVDRWESDCKYGMSSGCGIAGNMYIVGKWENANTGKFIKIKNSKSERMKKAEKLLKKGCQLGNKKSCNDYKKFFKGK